MLQFPRISIHALPSGHFLLPFSLLSLASGPGTYQYFQWNEALFSLASDLYSESHNRFYARRLSVERNSYGDVAGWLGGCHTPVLYQNR